MVVKIEVFGTREAMAFINRKRKKIDRLIPQALINAAFFVQGEVKQSIAGRRPEPRSVDTGRFLGSVDIASLGKDNAVIFSNVPYAKVLEFGGMGRSARRHFRNTKDRSKEKIVKLIKAKINSI